MGHRSSDRKPAIIVDADPAATRPVHGAFAPPVSTDPFGSDRLQVSAQRRGRGASSVGTPGFAPRNHVSRL
jgi:hypothetical protein